MAERSHLIRTTIIDANGHPKTVYRKPGDSSAAPQRNVPDMKPATFASARLVNVAPIDTQEFSLDSNDIDEAWAEFHREDNVEFYTESHKAWDGWNDYNENGTLNAQTSYEGAIYFIDPRSDKLVLTHVPNDYYFSGVSTPPIVETTDNGYAITYVVGDADNEDNRTVRFETDNNGDYSGKPATLNTFESNLAAETALALLSGRE